MYTLEEVREATLAYFGGGELQTNVWIDKYALKDKAGALHELTPAQMHIRLASEFARVDKEKYGLPNRFAVYQGAFENFARLVPQGSPMAAVGNMHQYLSASNCVVVDSPSDSMGGIMKAATELAQLYKRRCGVGIDMSTLRPEGMAVNNASKTTSGAWSFCDLMSYVTRLVGQCLHGDTKVLTSDGLLKISDVKPAMEVWTKKGWVKVLNVVQNKKPCIKLTTKFGHEIICSEDHVFHTINGEKRIGDLTIGAPITQIVGEGWVGEDIKMIKPIYDKVGPNHSNRLKEYDLPTVLDESLAYLLGAMYGNASAEENEISIAVAPNLHSVAVKLHDIIKDQFGYDVKIGKGDGCFRLRMSSKYIIEYLKVNELLKEKSHSIKFPTKLLNGTKNILFAFLSGFMDTDGNLSTKKKFYRMQSISKDFIIDIQNVLLSNGIPCKISREIKNKKLGCETWKDLYSVSINGSEAQTKFYNLMSHSIKVKSVPSFTKKRDFTRTCYRTKDFETKASKHSYIISDAQWITYSTCTRLKKDLNIDMQTLLLQDFVASKEVFENGAEQDVFDLVLEDEHLFYANGLYAHNSGRRGALMITMSIHHPDISKFITMKKDLKKVTGANVSVLVSNEFMRAVETGDTYKQYWPLEGEVKYSAQVDARSIWDLICKTATETAEPGVIFWNSMREISPTFSYDFFRSISTNPCSEIALSAYDSCRLLSINLTGYIRAAFEKSAYFDFDAFKSDVALAVHTLDNLVDIELELIDRIISICGDDAEKALWGKLADAGRRGRRIGLGTHGLADALAQLCMRYDSKEALHFCESLYETLRNSAYRASVDLARDRGAFPEFSWEVESTNEYISRLPDDIKADMAIYGRRNIALLTQAPTGSVSLLSKCGAANKYDVSSGVEPVFRTSYSRRRKKNPNDVDVAVDFVDELGDEWALYDVYHSNVQFYMEKFNTKKLPDYFVTSDSIDWKFRVKLQGVEQYYIDHSISSTINLPRGTSVDTVKNIYMDAWKNGLKGVTVYVDGSRDGVLITDERPAKIKRVQAPKRPQTLPCDVHSHVVNGEKWIAVVGLLDGEPYEIFGGYYKDVAPLTFKEGYIVKRKQGTWDLKDKDSANEITDLTTKMGKEFSWVTRLVSTSLRHGTPIEFMVEQLNKDGKLHDINRVLARVLKKYIKDGKVKSALSCNALKKDGTLCASTDIVWSEGCHKCATCGNTKC